MTNNAPCPEIKKKHEKMIRIATWNLGVPPKIAVQKHQAMIAEVQADIWIFTETREGFHPGNEFTCVAHSKEAGDLDEDRLWTAIWVRKSLAESAGRIETTDQQRTACARLMMPNNTTIYVYGTVLPWRGDQWHNHKSAGGVAFSKALAVQKADWKRLRCKHRESILFVAGDFNQDLMETRSIYNSWKQREKLKETLNDLKFQCLTELAADPVAEISPGHATIDHICVCGPQSPTRFPAKSYACPPVYQEKRLSDHFIVFTDVDLAR